MDKVIVIGGAGFIGSHVSDELSRRGFKVTVYDRRESPWVNKNQEMVVGDLLDKERLAEAAIGARYLYHFGGIADIGEAISKPFTTIQVNVMGTATVLEAAREAGVERFLYASTMYVYSNYGSFYRASKQAAETVIEAYAEHFSLDYTLLRYGSLYGPRAQSWNGLRQYINQIVRDRRLEYSGTGRERREYIHVRDAARLSVDVLDEQHRNQAVTVTGAQVLNSTELTQMIFEIAGVPENVKFTGGSEEGIHYGTTPYRYTPKQAKKIVPSEFIDLGQGVLDIVEEIHREMEGECGPDA